MGTLSQKFYNPMANIFKKGKTDIEKDYLFLNNFILMKYYKDILSLEYNAAISLQKKNFDKIVVLNQNILNATNLDRNIGWKDFLIDYALARYEKGDSFYLNVKEKIQNEKFLFENKYISMMFFKGMEIKYKPEVLDIYDSQKDNQGEEDELNEAILPKNLVKYSTDLENSKMNLSGITEHLGGSFNIGNKGRRYLEEEDNDMDENDDNNFNVNKRKLKLIIKVIKDHIIQLDHPINIVLTIFEEYLSERLEKEISQIILLRAKVDYYNEQEEPEDSSLIVSINDEIDENKKSDKLSSSHELNGNKNSEKNYVKRNNSTYESHCNLLSEQVIQLIQKFIIALSSAVKLFYSSSLDLQYFVEEKDELLNILISILFEKGSLYKNIYKLFEFQLENETQKFREILKKNLSCTPKDIGINPKFSLDERTKRKKEKFDNVKYERKISFENESETESNICSVKDKQSRNDVCKSSKNNVFISLNKDNENYGIVRNDVLFAKKSSKNAIDFEANKRKNERRNTKFEIKYDKLFNNAKFRKIGYTAVVRIFSGLQKIQKPFEKIMLISKMADEIIECIDCQWEDYKQVIDKNYLSITPDEFISIFIFTILQSQMYTLLIHEKFVQEFLSRTTKSSAIGYYNTLFNAALEAIRTNKFLKNNEDNKKKKKKKKENEVSNDSKSKSSKSSVSEKSSSESEENSELSEDSKNSSSVASEGSENKKEETSNKKMPKLEQNIYKIAIEEDAKE